MALARNPDVGHKTNFTLVDHCSVRSGAANVVSVIIVECVMSSLPLSLSSACNSSTWAHSLPTYDWCIKGDWNSLRWTSDVLNEVRIKACLTRFDNCSYTCIYFNQLCNRFTELTSFSKSKDKSLNVPESKSVANNSCCCVSKSIITHCSPTIVVIHFKTSFICSWASNQSHCKQQDKVSVDQ